MRYILALAALLSMLMCSCSHHKKTNDLTIPTSKDNERGDRLILALYYHPGSRAYYPQSASRPERKLLAIWADSVGGIYESGEFRAFEVNSRYTQEIQQIPNVADLYSLKNYAFPGSQNYTMEIHHNSDKPPFVLWWHGVYDYLPYEEKSLQAHREVWELALYYLDNATIHGPCDRSLYRIDFANTFQDMTS